MACRVNHHVGTTRLVVEEVASCARQVTRQRRQDEAESKRFMIKICPPLTLKVESFATILFPRCEARPGYISRYGTSGPLLDILNIIDEVHDAFVCA